MGRSTLSVKLFFMFLPLEIKNLWKVESVSWVLAFFIQKNCKLKVEELIQILNPFLSFLGVAYTRTLNLGRLVTSDLNPLKACQEQVAVFFVDAAHQHQISYCRTVLERNQRVTIPTICQDTLTNLGSHSELLSSNQLESFFPFDPFLLIK